MVDLTRFRARPPSGRAGLSPRPVIPRSQSWVHRLAGYYRALLIGGLLGPILAVPLTATIKVLLTRYVWGPSMRERVRAQVESVPVVRESQGET